MIKAKYSAAITDKPWWLAGGIPASACVAAYQAKGASSLAASLINLANPGVYNCTTSVTPPNWTTALGWYGDGTSAMYLDTGIIPKIGYSVIALVNMTLNSAYGYNAPSTGSGNYIWGIYHTNSPRIYYQVGNGAQYIASGKQISVLAISGRDCYKNGIYLANISTGTTEATANLLILSSSSNSTYFRGAVYAEAIYNTTITQAQVTALTNAMNAL